MDNIPLATLINEPTANGANGILLTNSKIKTCYKNLGTSTEYKWYTGKITEIHNNNICTIEYDIGFTVKGDAKYVHLL